MILNDDEDTLTDTIKKGIITKEIKAWYEEYKGYIDNHERTYAVRYGYQQGPNFNRYNYLCHRYLADINLVKNAYVVHMFTQQITPEQTRYIDYLVSFDNPYEKLSEHATVFITPKQKAGMVVFDWQKVPSKLCINYLEASRLGSCWGLAELWCYLVDNGVNKDIALALIVYYQWSGHTTTFNTPLSRVGPKPYKAQEILHISNTHSNDQPFNSCVTNNQDYTKVGQYFRIDKFLRRDPSTLKAQDEPQPCNHIWDSKVKKSMFATETSKTNKTLNTIKERYTKEQPLPEGMADYINKTLLEGGQLD